MNKLQGPYKSLMCLNIPVEREKCVLKKKKVLWQMVISVLQETKVDKNREVLSGQWWGSFKWEDQG